LFLSWDWTLPLDQSVRIMIIVQGAWNGPETVEDEMMNHLLIEQLARADMAERLQAIERERLARSAGRSARRRDGRIVRAAHRVAASLSSWRMRTQLGAMPVPLCSDGPADTRST
jgi:hypothetical protein